MSVQTRKLTTSRTFYGRSKDQRGAALIEAAIIFMPLCIILFGIIEYGFIFKDSLTLSSATRAGARTASAAPKQTDFYTATVAAVTKGAQAASFKNGDTLFIYKADSNGNPTGGNEKVCAADCQRYVWNGSTFAQSGGGTWAISSQVACLGNADSVGVRLQLSHDAISGFAKNIQLSEKTVMRLEPVDSDCA